MCENMQNEREMFSALRIMEEALDIMDEDSLDMTTEGYVGRVKETQEIEKNFKVLHERYKNAGLVDISLADIHGSREIKNIESALEDLTGFRKVDIIVKNETVVNAYTCPGSLVCRAISNDMPTIPTDHGKRYYDKSHSYYCMIVIYAKMFEMMEADELTATVLHEIGHNFDHTISNWLFDLLIWVMTIPSGPIGVLKNIFRTQVQYIIDSLLKVLDYIPIIPILKNFGVETIRGFGMLLGPLGAVSQISSIIQNVADNPAGAALGGIRVQSETFADSYVNSMGYGDAMIRAFNKMEQWNYVTKHGGFIEFWTGSGYVAASMLMMFIDPHPEMQSRARYMLDEMEKTAKDKDVPPHMRKALAEQHKRMEKAYKEFLQADKDERNATCTRFARRIKESLFGGKVDIRLVLLQLMNARSAMQSR
jgi:Zn-dependent protease with chaperone function